MCNKTWNPAFNMVMEIKNAYLKEFGIFDMFPTIDKAEILEKFNYIDKYNLYDGEMPLFTIKGTSLGYWVAKLVYFDIKYLEYAKMIQPLEINQNNHLLLLRYGDDKSMWDEDFWDKYDGLYRECRSVVIDIYAEALVMTPFKKFFNLNEKPETNIDVISEKIKNATLIEFANKLDGSMQCARFYNEEYIMTGSQALNAEQSWRLADGYLMLTENHKKMLADFPAYTFIFEYISMNDAHIVKYDKSEEGLYLIGVRYVHTGQEWSYAKVLQIANYYNIRTTEKFDKTLEQVMSELDDKTSAEAEGFVINIDGFKVKLKYNDYTQVHGVLSKISSVNIVIKSVADGTFDDLYSKIPNAHKPRILRLANIIKDYESDIKAQAIKLCEEAKLNTNTIKDLMLYIENSSYSKKIQSFAKCVYTNKPLYILKRDFGLQSHYIKFNEIEEYYGGKIDVN